MARSRRNTSAETRWWGPAAVALGAGLWGLESVFRVHLQDALSSGSLVLIEHILAVVLLIPVFIFGAKHVRHLTWRLMGWMLISGVVGSAIGTIFFTASLVRMNVTVANVLLNLQPLVSVSLAVLLLKEKLAHGFGRWAAVAVLAGMVLSLESITSFRIHSPSGLLCIAVTIFCWGIATVAGRAVMVELPLSFAGPLRFFLGMFGALLMVALNGEWGHLGADFHQLSHPWVLREYALLLGVAGITPLFLYFHGFKYTKAYVGAFCEMTQTIAAATVSWIFLGAALRPHQILAGVVLVAAVTKINLIQAQRK